MTFYCVLWLRHFCSTQVLHVRSTTRGIEILTDEEVFVLVVVGHVFFLFDPKLWEEEKKSVDQAICTANLLFSIYFPEGLLHTSHNPHSLFHDSFYEELDISRLSCVSGQKYVFSLTFPPYFFSDCLKLNGSTTITWGKIFHCCSCCAVVSRTDGIYSKRGSVPLGCHSWKFPSRTNWQYLTWSNKFCPAGVPGTAPGFSVLLFLLQQTFLEDMDTPKQPLWLSLTH